MSIVVGQLSLGERATAEAAPWTAAAVNGPSDRWRGRLSAPLLASLTAAVDFLLVVFGGAIATAVSTGEKAGALSGGRNIIAILAAVLFVGGFERIGGYTLARLVQTRWQLLRTLAVWAATVSCVLPVGIAIDGSGIFSRLWTLSWISIVPVGLVAKVGVGGLLFKIGYRGGAFARNIAIVGAGSEAQHLIARLRETAPGRFVVHGVFGDREEPVPASICDAGMLGTTNELFRLARSRSIDEVIIALPLTADKRLQELGNKLREIAIDVRLSLQPLAEIFGSGGADGAVGCPLLPVIEKPIKGWRAPLKWTEDLLLAWFLILLFGPLMVLLSILIKLDSRGPILFTQERFGLNNAVINVLKFRTMHVDRSDASGAERTVRDDPRVTRFGRILRRLSLDELPQLINVLRGEMSLVGPRPHAVKMKVGECLYGEAVAQYRHRHRVKPGITGWAQVNGSRGEVDTLEKAAARVRFDLHYIDHWSLWLDLKILLRTAVSVLACESAW